MTFRKMFRKLIGIIRKLSLGVEENKWVNKVASPFDTFFSKLKKYILKYMNILNLVVSKIVLLVP